MRCAPSITAVSSRYPHGLNPPALWEFGISLPTLGAIVFGVAGLVRRQWNAWWGCVLALVAIVHDVVWVIFWLKMW
jgi:hypothetical protein